MDQLREGFQTGYLHVAEPETNEFSQAVEAYSKVAERKSWNKQVLIFPNS
jgi:hypothetical protein